MITLVKAEIQENETDILEVVRKRGINIFEHHAEIMDHRIKQSGRNSHLRLRGVKDKFFEARSLQELIKIYEDDGRASLKIAHGLILAQYNHAFDFHKNSDDKLLGEYFQRFYVDVLDRRETRVKTDLQCCDNLVEDLKALPKVVRFRRAA